MFRRQFVSLSSLHRHWHAAGRPPSKWFSTKLKTMQDVASEVAAKFGITIPFKPTKTSGREHLEQFEPKSADDLPARTMLDSYSEALIPLGTDAKLREKHMTAFATVRYGRLLEAMDMFAVWVVVNHLKLNNLKPGEPLPHTIVTMLVDSISFAHEYPQFDKDIRLSGHVCWVGKSSLEAVVLLEQLSDTNNWRKVTSSLFLMAGRNAANTKALALNSLTTSTPEEEQIFKGGEVRKQKRLLLKNASLFVREPSADEQKVIHDLFVSTIEQQNLSLNQRILPADAHWMSDSTLSNLVYSHPENRNTQNTVFGGYLMRQSLELSWSLAYMFTKKRPRLEYISDVTFTRPVKVSSMILMRAYVVYTEQNYMQIVVMVEVQNLENFKEKKTISNVFHYTYLNESTVPSVLPNSYHEAMWYLDGRRHFQRAMLDRSADQDHAILSRPTCS